MPIFFMVGCLGSASVIAAIGIGIAFSPKSGKKQVQGSLCFPFRAISAKWPISSMAASGQY